MNWLDWTPKGSNIEKGHPEAPPNPPERNPAGNRVHRGEVLQLLLQETAKLQVGRWMAERCTPSWRAWAAAKFLVRDFAAWCHQHNELPGAQGLFCAVLDECFVRDGEGWAGICLTMDWEVSAYGTRPSPNIEKGCPNTPPKPPKTTEEPTFGSFGSGGVAAFFINEGSGGPIEGKNDKGVEDAIYTNVGGLAGADDLGRRHAVNSGITRDSGLDSARRKHLSTEVPKSYSPASATDPSEVPPQSDDDWEDL